MQKKVRRPKKNRVRAPTELKLKHKLSRVWQVQHCSLCGSTIHKNDRCSKRPSKLVKESHASTSSNPRKKTTRGGSHGGLGLYVNVETGKQVLNPGRSLSIVINEGSLKESDPNTRFSIPNEANIRKKKRKRGPNSAAGGPSKVKKDASKPFKAPRGKATEPEKQHILRRSHRGKNVISTVESTTTS